MPIIDVFAPADLFPPEADADLARELTHALLRAEGAPLTSPFIDNTAAYIHRLPNTAVHTAAVADARTVRVQVLTPPGALDREAQKAVVAELTGIVARTTDDPAQADRTWVLLTEAAEGGWGVAGTAYGQAELAALTDA